MSEQNRLEELSPEQLSLAFQFLANQQPVPQELKHLSVEEWERLAQTLDFLMLEKDMSNLH